MTDGDRPTQNPPPRDHSETFGPIFLKRENLAVYREEDIAQSVYL